MTTWDRRISLYHYPAGMSQKGLHLQLSSFEWACILCKTICEPGPAFSSSEEPTQKWNGPREISSSANVGAIVIQTTSICSLIGPSRPA